MAIKQRTGIPGGACEFDLPSYHYWLHRETDERHRRPQRAGSRRCCRSATARRIVLQLLRESGKPARLIAPQGTFQQMLGGQHRADAPHPPRARTADCVPEISANKYALNIRFVDAAAPSRGRGRSSTTSTSS